MMVTLNNELTSFCKNVGNKKQYKIIVMTLSNIAHIFTNFCLTIKHRLQGNCFMLCDEDGIISNLELFGVRRNKRFNRKLGICSTALKYLQAKFSCIFTNDICEIIRLNTINISGCWRFQNNRIGHNRGK